MWLDRQSKGRAETSRPFFGFERTPKRMKVKIVEPGYAGYTGLLGQIEFVDAVSVNDVPTREALWVGGILRIVEVDDAGNELGSVSHADELVRTRHLDMPITPEMETGDVDAPSPDSEEARVAKELAEAKAPDPLPVTPAEDDEPAKVYTRAELEAIADDKGIAGLRDIGSPLGAKHTSIPGLIEAILTAYKQAAQA